MAAGGGMVYCTQNKALSIGLSCDEKYLPLIHQRDSYRDLTLSSVLQWHLSPESIPHFDIFFLLIPVSACEIIAMPCRSSWRQIWHQLRKLQLSYKNSQNNIIMLAFTFTLVSNLFVWVQNKSYIGMMFWMNSYTPCFNEVEREVYWYHLVRLSICGQNPVRSVSSTILIRSISYLRILSSNFRRCVAFKIKKLEILANFFNL